MKNEFKLWYQQPAKVWEEVLPIGNGALGGMIWGTVAQEKIGLNQETLWSGFYQDKNKPEAKLHLAKVREHIFAKKLAEADELIREELLGEYGESYLPAGNLLIEFDHSDKEITKYQRELNIDNAVAKVSYDYKNRPVEREYFVSYPHQAMFVKISGTKLSVNLAYEADLVHNISLSEKKLVIKGQCPEHVDPNYVTDTPDPIIQGTRGQKFHGEIKVLATDGDILNKESVLTIENFDELVLMISLVKQPMNIHDKTYDEIKNEHLKDYHSIYAKVDVSFGPKTSLATDQRLKDLRLGHGDPDLFALYFQYGRYLLIASSREGTLPANLQGIWNWELRAPWSSNWTTNINLEMNYWHVQTCNLEECLPPYLDFMERVVAEGKKTASINYGARGFVVHHNLDYWLNTSPVGIVRGETKGREQSTFWSMWPMAGAWMCQEVFKQFEYHQDYTYLADVAYPILREATLFLVDWLIERNGQVTTAPSSSPENQFIFNEEGPFGIDQMVAMDIQLIEEVFGNYLSTLKLLELNDEALKQEVEAKLAQLPAVQIGSDGRLLEWQEEYVENEPGHRHLSHLYGLFPAENFANHPELIEASRRSLIERLAQDSGHTGWSCAWIINLFSILEDGENAFHYLKQLLTESTLDNLWDTHPPFQIDGNFGGTAGIANMLVHERNGELKILPALPKEFKEGYVKGLRLKNKRTIDIYWKNNELSHYEIYHE